MSIRTILGLILSIFVTGAMIWACSFEIQQIMMGELVTAAGGKYKFLTILNLHLQAIYYIICIINFFFGTDTIETGKRSFLQKLRDLIYAGAAFPIGMYVCIAFWGIYHVDRELIYPKELDGLVSPVLNHVMHTLPGVALCLENLVHYHRYPSRFLGLTLVVSLFAAYTTWIHYLHHIHWLAFKVSLWVYPILNELSFTYRGLFFLGSALFGIGLYFIGEMYTLMLTSLRVDRAGRNKKKY
ncbi:unnamed protein product [Adineta steineri]|uniref:Androgen-induced gene 1 protein n=2 Tax=Adineta steineri TaxID=433720 RepID=A0A820G045_9BILA|nr:unnamed protein product [Adineta steineri]